MISKGCGEGDGEGTRPYVQQAPAAYGKPPPGLRRRMYDVIFEADTPAGRRFDIALVAAIMASILVVVLDSVPRLHRDHADLLGACEWGFTLLFTAEYLARLMCVRRPWLYIEEYTRLGEALAASRRKILVFLSVVLMAILILGTVMYVVEGPKNGYTSIPVAMYWATVTMTTSRACAACAACGSAGHEADARFCKDCGAALPARTGHSGKI